MINVYQSTKILILVVLLMSIGMDLAVKLVMLNVGLVMDLKIVMNVILAGKLKSTLIMKIKRLNISACQLKRIITLIQMNT
jgi:hypothetical protein